MGVQERLISAPTIPSRGYLRIEELELEAGGVN